MDPLSTSRTAGSPGPPPTQLASAGSPSLSQTSPSARPPINITIAAPVPRAASLAPLIKDTISTESTVSSPDRVPSNSPRGPAHADLAPYAKKWKKGVSMPEAQSQELPEELDGYSSAGRAVRGRGAYSLLEVRAVQKARAFVLGNSGLLLVACGQLFFALMNVTVKILNSLETPVPVLQLVVIRMGVTYLCCIAYMLLTGVPNPFTGPPGVRGLLVLRGVAGFTGLSTLYYSLGKLSLADATVLQFLMPTATAMVAPFVLGEKTSVRELFAGVASLCGVILIARPPFLFPSATAPEPDAASGMAITPSQRLLAVGVSMIGVCGGTVAFLTIRAIGKRAHALHSLTSFSLQSTIVGIIGMLVSGTAFVLPTRPLWLALLALIGLFGFAAQFLLTLGLQRETAARGSMGMYAQIVFAETFDLLVLHTVPSKLSLTGTAIILTAGVYVAVSKQNVAAGDTPRHEGDAELEEGLLMAPIVDEDHDGIEEEHAVAQHQGLASNHVSKENQSFS